MEKTIGGISNIDEIVFAPKQSKIQIPVCNKTVISDLSEDFTLPDYLPEIRRLLRITPHIQIPARYISSSLSEFSGNVNWSVLYVTSDGELACAELFSPFEVSAEYDTDTKADLDGDFEAFDDIVPENVVGRVTAPRKLNIRCRLSHSIKAYGEMNTDADIYGNAEEDTIKRLVRSIHSCVLKRGIDDTVELEETIPLPEGVRAVSCDGSVIITDLMPSSDGINARGNVNLKLIISKDGVPSITERKIPFEATVPAELDGDGWKCRGYGKISDISLDRTENDAVCRIHLSVATEAQKEVPTQYTADIFSTACKCENLNEEILIPSSLVSGSFNFSHDGSAEIDGLPENAQVIDSQVIALPESVALENDRYVLLGKCKYNTLYMSDGEYSARETEFPFRCELSSGEEKPVGFSANVCVNSCRVRKEGENMAFSADMTASLTAFGEVPTVLVSEASFGDDDETEKSIKAAFTVAYPSAEDTLWDLAKRYSIDPSDLAAENGIKQMPFDSKDSLADVKYLIV
ncbi:MAG: hypothetical protein E7587_10025 [Ruminococcaceae bacterium]|nr:hypothetical protein [Oscillospiraceae bacterium]